VVATVAEPKAEEVFEAAPVAEVPAEAAIAEGAPVAEGEENKEAGKKETAKKE
jgi:hypothetical protein